MQIPASTNSRLERLRQHRSNIRRCARELGIELGGTSASVANRPDQASSRNPHADLIVVGESARIDRRESAGTETPELRTSSEVMRTRLKPAGANYSTLATNAENLVQGWLQQDANRSDRYSDPESSRRNDPGPNLHSEDAMLDHKAQESQAESPASRSFTSVLRPAVEAPNLAATFSSSASASKLLDDRSFISEHSMGAASEQGLQDLQGTLSQSLSPQSKQDSILLASSTNVRTENQFGAPSSQLATGEAQARQSASSSASQLLAALAWQEDMAPMSSKHTAEVMRSPSGRTGVLDSSLRPVAEEIQSPPIQSPPCSANGHDVQMPPTFGGILEKWRNLNSDFQQVVNQSAGLPQASISFSSSGGMLNDSDDPEMVLQRIKRDLGLGGDTLGGSIGDEMHMPAQSMLSGSRSNGTQPDFFQALPNLGAKSDFLKKYPKDFGLQSPFLQGLPGALVGVPSAKQFDSVSQGLHEPMVPKVFDSFNVGSRASDLQEVCLGRQDSSSHSVEVEHMPDGKRKSQPEVVLNKTNASSSPGVPLNSESHDCKSSSDGALLEEQLDHWHDLDYSRTDVTEVSMESKERQLDTESIANKSRQTPNIGLTQIPNRDPQEHSGEIGGLSLSPRRPGDATISAAGEVADRFQSSMTSLMLSSTASSLFGSRIDMQSTSENRQNADIGSSTVDILRGPADESAGPPAATRTPSKSVQHSGSQTMHAEFQKPRQEFRDAEVDTSELESLRTDQRRALDSPVVQRQTVETQTTPRAPSRSGAGINIDVHSPRARPPLVPQSGSPSGIWDGGVLDQFRFSSQRLQSARSSSSPPSQSSRVDHNGYSCLAPTMTRQNVPHDTYQMLHHYPKSNPPLQEDCSTRNFGLPMHASHGMNINTPLDARFGHFSGYAGHEHNPFSSFTASAPEHEINSTILSERDDKLLTRAYEVYRRQQLDLMRGR